MGEVRYNSLKLKAPEKAAELFTKAESEANIKYQKLLREKKDFDEQ